MNHQFQLEHISKHYNGKDVLKDLSLHIREGAVLCLMGPSGCGKTTLLRILAGLDQPDTGRVVSEGKCSMVFQEDRLLTHLPALQNLQFVLGRGRTREALAMLEELGLHSEEQKPVSAFSGGMARRVAIARALLSDYDFLLLDEPFKGLDEDNRSLAARCILHHNRGRTLVMVSHDPKEAFLLRAEVVYMNSLNKL